MDFMAIVGMAGSGKTELSRFFTKKGYEVIRFGDITDEILKKKGMDLTEENEKKTREGFRKEYGMEAYAKLNLKKIQESLGRKNTVIDGLYSWEEYTFLKEKFPNMIVLAVYAPPETRYRRLNEREVRPLTREEAQQRDFKEIENLNKAAPIVMAEYTITNVGTLFDLENSFDKFIEWVKEKNEAKLG